MSESSWFPVSVEPEALAHYRHGLGCTSHRQGLLALASSIAASPGWREMAPDSILVVRPTPTPVSTRPSLAVLGQWDDDVVAWLQGQGQELSPACGHLCYLDDQATRDAAVLLAEKLRRQFSDQELARARFTAIPRGGLIVLGYLAIALGLRGEQLASSPKPSDSLLVVVDDCSLTGARFGEIARQSEFSRLAFVHLYSHPDLRQAIVSQETRVEAVLAAYDLEERLSHLPGGWRQKRLEQLGGGRYWIGLSETLCFPWNEPDRLIWNAVRAVPQTAWHIVPPELCLKNRSAIGSPPIAVQVLEEGPGPLAAAPDVLWGEVEDRVVIGDMKSGASFALAGVAGQMWRSLLRGGGFKPALADLTQQYSVDQATLEQDLETFMDQLNEAGLIVDGSNSSLRPEGSAAPNSAWLTHRIFGCTLASNFPFSNRLEKAETQRSAAQADLTFSCQVPTGQVPTGQVPTGQNQAGLELLYSSPYRISKTASVCDLYRGSDYDLLRFNGVGDFYLRDDRIDCHRAEAVPNELIEIRFLGAVLGFWLERRGIPALHGSAVDVGGQLAVFLSSNRGGKTGLAAALLNSGHTLVTDDLLPVGESEAKDAFLGHGGYPQMRMWPDEAEHFFAGGRVTNHVHPIYSKRRIHVGSNGLGRFDGESRPLGCFYLPERHEDSGDLVTITPVPAEEALEALTELSFSPRLVAAAGFGASRRAFLRRVLERVPVRRLVYRSGFELLPQVAAEIERDLAAGS